MLHWCILLIWEDSLIGLQSIKKVEMIINNLNCIVEKGYELFELIVGEAILK